MQNRIRLYAAVLLSIGSVGATACGHGHDSAADTAGYSATNVPATGTANGQIGTDTAATADTAATHHSKLKGAVVGAVAGHYMGHHALAGAAAGALIQHERNKHR